MSELKWNWAYSPYLDPPEKQKESAQNAGYVKVVSKDEADKVIARHKYKRCLNNAWWLLREEFFAEDCHCERWVDWAIKWYKRWLELAEKFKEAK